MNRVISIFFAGVAMLLMPVAVYAETSGRGDGSSPGGIGVWEALRPLGLFVLVMAIIYILLIFTRKIASWIDEHKK
ncbi:MAG: hypothetical protein LBU86_05175 [Oscillospiraceae bacterium]|jgi:predicted small integral membrane protein|nr:hypothetical protein [Oscillospiraceae bacterium]